MVLDLPEGVTGAGLHGQRPAAELAGLDSRLGGGRLGPPAEPDILRDQDRVEVYRPLRVDPKVARRERFRGRAAGGRPVRKEAGGAKAGY